MKSFIRFTAGCIVFHFIFLITNTAYSYGTADSLNIERGTYALQFQITSNFTLRHFQGSLISFKRHFSENQALRVGINSSFDIEETEQINADESFVSNGSDASSLSLSLHTQYLQYSDTPMNTIKLYYGAGPTGQYAHSSVVQLQEQLFNGETRHREIVQSSTEWSAGITGSLGVEWFASKQISILAEYNSTISYVTGRNITEVVFFDPQDEPYKDRVEFSGYKFFPGGIRFGLSVYI